MVNFLLTGIFQDLILPFILIFALIFAILQKTRLLGEGVQQINAVIAFVIAGIFVAFSQYVVWLRSFTIFLAISLFILFAFMLIYGFTYAGKEGFTLSNELKILITTIAFIGVVIAALIITGTWDRVYQFFTESNTGSTVVVIIIIAAAITAVLYGGKKEGSK
jgi:hypothetical protein